MPRPNVNVNKCLNPKSRYCDCTSCSEEKRNLASLRNQVVYSGIPGSIVEWTLSDSWTTVTESATKNSRGTWFTETDVYWGNDTHGEIPWR